MNQINTFQKYPAYKDSGVEWIGEVPASWEVRRLKYVVNVNQNSLPENTDKSFLIEYVDIGGVTFENGITQIEQFSFKDSPSRARRIAKTGDTIVSTVRTYLKAIDYVDNVKSGYIYSTGFAVLSPVKVTPHFLLMLARSDVFTNQVDVFSKGMSYPAINSTELSRLHLPVPSKSEQTRIATFLDQKTAQIDQAIAQKERLIELLKERRQILIHNAVTRGLDPNVRMKESGVDWIGEVPEHWEMKRMKHVTLKIGSGITPSGGGTSYLDEGIPLLRSQNILLGKIEFEGVALISEKTHAEMSNSQVKNGDVLLNITGGSIGRCHFVEVDFPINVNQHVCIVRPSKSISTVFLNAILASEIGQGQIWFFQQGGGREGLNFQALKNFFIPLPPLKEQIAISEQIKTVTTKIATAISLKQSEIEKLKEYKATLINSAVTGKIKVV